MRLFYLFFFKCLGSPRVLHSFPTRRSSDLSGSGRYACASFCPPPHPYCAHGLVRARLPCAQYGCRSEEHTSELQSLRHLVCRLLLEKKKNLKLAHAKRIIQMSSLLLIQVVM